EWVHRSGAADVDADYFEPGGGDLTRELVRDCPARVAAYRAKELLIFEAIDLYHDSVDFVVERVAFLLPFAAECDDAVNRFMPSIVRVHRQAPVLQHLQDVFLGLDGFVFDVAYRISKESKRARSCHSWIELPDRARGRVSGVRKLRFPSVGALFVKRVESRDRQIDLASDLDQWNMFGALEAERNLFDRFEICGDVFADYTVAASRAPDKAAVLIGESDRQSVDFHLSHICEFVAIQQPADSLVECAELLFVERIGEAEHGRVMVDLVESLERFAADALSWRIGRGKFGMGLLDFEQLAEHAVVFRVGDFRRVFGVIK